MENSLPDSQRKIKFEGGELVLTPQGMTCPMTLLVKEQSKALEKHGLTQITIRWDSIKSWNAVIYPYFYHFFYLRYYRFSLSNFFDAYYWYDIGLKSVSDILTDKKLLLSRRLLRNHEAEIIDYAQPYMGFKLAPLQLNLKNSWLFILIAILSIGALVLAMSKCNLLDSDCMNNSKIF